MCFRVWGRVFVRRNFVSKRSASAGQSAHVLTRHRPADRIGPHAYRPGFRGHGTADGALCASPVCTACARHLCRGLDRTRQRALSLQTGGRRGERGKHHRDPAGRGAHRPEWRRVRLVLPRTLPSAPEIRRTHGRAARRRCAAAGVRSGGVRRPGVVPCFAGLARRADRLPRSLASQLRLARGHDAAVAPRRGGRARHGTRGCRRAPSAGAVAGRPQRSVDSRRSGARGGPEPLAPQPCVLAQRRTAAACLAQPVAAGAGQAPAARRAESGGGGGESGLCRPVASAPAVQARLRCHAWRLYPEQERSRPHRAVPLVCGHDFDFFCLASPGGTFHRISPRRARYPAAAPGRCALRADFRCAGIGQSAGHRRGAGHVGAGVRRIGAVHRAESAGYRRQRAGRGVHHSGRQPAPLAIRRQPAAADGAAAAALAGAASVLADR